MLDAKLVRDNLELVEEAMKDRNASWDTAAFTRLDETRRGAIAREEALQAERNAASKTIGKLMAEAKGIPTADRQGMCAR